MEREIINLLEIFDYKDLFLEGGAGYNEKEDTFLYEVVKEEILYYDLEQSYLYKYIVFVRNSDGKYFSCEFKESPYRSDFPKTASEVFPVEVHITDTIFK